MGKANKNGAIFYDYVRKLTMMKLEPGLSLHVNFVRAMYSIVLTPF